MEELDEIITEEANKAAMSGDLETLKSIVAKNPKVLLEESEGRTPISIFIDKMDDLLDLFDLFEELPVDIFEEDGKKEIFLKNLFHAAIDAIEKRYAFEDKKILKEIKDLVEENFEENFDSEPIDEQCLGGKE